MKIYRCGPTVLALVLAVILMGGFHPAGALAQCGGLSGSGNCQAHMNSSGYMGKGHHMGQTENAAPGQTNQTTINPNIATNPSASGYAMPDATTGSGGAAPDHSGHTGR